jgi:hypothetical protein
MLLLEPALLGSSSIDYEYQCNIEITGHEDKKRM